MGRRPTIPGGLPRLTPRQREMLLLTIATGMLANWTRAKSHSAWTIRILRPNEPSVIRTYGRPVGERLLQLGYIAVHPDPDLAEMRNPATGELFGRRYVATAAGVARVQTGGGE